MSHRLELRVPTEDIKRWRVTAALDGIPLAEWVRRRCNAGAVDQRSVTATDNARRVRDARKAGA